MAVTVKTALRPGLQFGAYPEAGSETTSWLDDLVCRVSGYIAARLKWHERRLRKFASAVEQTGERLSALPEENFRRRIEALTRVLRRDGLAEEHMVMAFAIVREASGRVLGMRHYGVQIMAGRVLIDGKLAEMETGEGKTLMATLPASVAGLAGIPVHVITVNDYLVARDAAQMQPLYEYLGLTTGVVGDDMETDERRAAYAADITYCTNKTLVFDYLRDRMMLKDVHGPVSMQADKLYSKKSRLDSVLMRGLCYCIVDEADSVLIDEAGTPLILSQGGQVLEKDVILYRQAVELARALKAGKDFSIDEKLRSVKLTEAGKQRVVELGAEIGGQWQMRTRCEELASQALSACHLFLRDREYLVKDEKVMIIDDSTGRVMGDRKWERGLHQMIEIKEGCEVSAPNEVLARLSYQKFFRRYLHLSGMTGTARETAGELRAVYGLKVIKIPTHHQSQLQHYPDQLYATQESKWRRVVTRVIEVHKQQRPVLVGTRSVADSETIGRMLERAGLPCQLLNARQDEGEAQLVARAGEPGAITIATNMAGRGTDIPLTEAVREKGGLHVIATDRNSARRIDRQLYGRAGRQGAPGSYESILALDDRIIADYMPQFLRKLAEIYVRDPHPLPKWVMVTVVSYCQRKSELQQYRQRDALAHMDEYLGKMLGFSGNRE